LPGIGARIRMSVEERVGEIVLSWVIFETFVPGASEI
jgi:hypothetical protein